MQRHASTVWQGDLKSGKGSISTESGVLKQTQYSFGTRFKTGVGTNRPSAEPGFYQRSYATSKGPETCAAS